MNNAIIKYFENMKMLGIALEMLNSEEIKAHCAILEKETFDIDVLTMTEEEEEKCKVLYNMSAFICAMDGFVPIHAYKAFSNVNKQLKPLFEDATEYLNKEPNKSHL